MHRRTPSDPFTSESVTEGHPDKETDRVSDAVLDAHPDQDPRSGPPMTENPTRKTKLRLATAEDLRSMQGWTVFVPIVPRQTPSRPPEPEPEPRPDEPVSMSPAFARTQLDRNRWAVAKTLANGFLDLGFPREEIFELMHYANVDELDLLLRQNRPPSEQTPEADDR